MADPSCPTDIGVPCQVVASDEQTDVVVETERWGELAEAVLRAEGGVGELTLTFVDRTEIEALNAEHMGQAAPTDVLSFPLDADETLVPAGPVLLGDVVICPAVAADAAPDHAGSVDDELALLTVHGVLHVLGHDHADPHERAEMRARELRHLVDHHWRGPAPEGFRHEQGGS